MFTCFAGASHRYVVLSHSSHVTFRLFSERRRLFDPMCLFPISEKTSLHFGWAFSGAEQRAPLTQGSWSPPLAQKRHDGRSSLESSGIAATGKREITLIQDLEGANLVRLDEKGGLGAFRFDRLLILLHEVAFHHPRDLAIEE